MSPIPGTGVIRIEWREKTVGDGPGHRGIATGDARRTETGVWQGPDQGERITSVR